MTYAVISTKLYIPQARSSVVSRARLLGLLDENSPRRLTLVCAPAGFGKTTLVADWVGHFQTPVSVGGPQVCWLSLDDGDNDPARFWNYFLAALKKVAPQFGQVATAHIPSLSSFDESRDEFLAALMNEFERVQQDMLLVLEDYHAIHTASIHQTLAYLLEYLPARLRLVITSREDPPLPLSRLRARGELYEIRADDLRFTQEEAERYLSRVMGLNLSTEEVEALEARTEGWIAGLHLAALAQQSQRNERKGDRQDRASTHYHRYITDYLIDEVLEHQPKPVQDFLLTTSILDRMTADLCTAVTGQAGAQEILKKLEDIHLFIVPLDDEGHWFRYHHLFAEALRSRLNWMSAKSEIGLLYQKASRWFDQEGLVDEAVHYALRAPDLERAADLIERHGERLLWHGDLLVLRGWLDSIPEAWLYSRPWLTLLFAWTLLLSNRLEAAEKALARVEPLLSQPEGQAIAGEVVTLQAYIARNRGDWERTDELAAQALEQVSIDYLSLRSATCLVYGDASAEKGRVDDACQAYEQAAEQGERGGNLYVALASLHRLGWLQLRLGRLKQAMLVFEKALQLTRVQDGPPLKAAALAYAGVGEVLRERNELEPARSFLEKAMELLECLYESKALANTAFSLARTLQALGQPEPALQALNKGAELLQRKNAPDSLQAQVRAYQVCLHLWQGDLRFGLGDERRRSDLEHPVHLLTVARGWIGRGRALEDRQPLWDAIRLLEKLAVRTQEQGWVGELLEINLQLALAWQALARHDTASKYLERALQLAEPEGYVRVFIDEGPAMESLLRSHLPASEQRRYVKKLLEVFRSQPRVEQPARDGHTFEPLADLAKPLTRQEAEVLHRLADGLSNQEIAADFGLSESTILTHIKHIYRKLEVHNRTQAVARARRLGILVGNSGSF